MKQLLMVIVILVHSVYSSITYGQDKIDSLKIIYIPFSVQGRFLNTEESLQQFDEHYRKEVIITDSVVLKKFKAIETPESDSINYLKNIEFNPYVLFEIYSKCKSYVVLMDCFGRCLYEKSLTFNLKLSTWFREKTNQKEMNCF
jgi:hypothetical protein